MRKKAGRMRAPRSGMVDGPFRNGCWAIQGWLLGRSTMVVGPFRDGPGAGHRHAAKIYRRVAPITKVFCKCLQARRAKI